MALAVHARYVSGSLLAEGKEATPWNAALLLGVSRAQCKRAGNQEEFESGVGSRSLMYKYEEPSLFSGKRGAALLAVLVLHVLMVWAFYTGLAGKGRDDKIADSRQQIGQRHSMGMFGDQAH